MWNNYILIYLWFYAGLSWFITIETFFPGLHVIVKFQPLPVLLGHFAKERQRGEPRVKTIATHGIRSESPWARVKKTKTLGTTYNWSWLVIFRTPHFGLRCWSLFGVSCGSLSWHLDKNALVSPRCPAMAFKPQAPHWMHKTRIHNKLPVDSQPCLTCFQTRPKDFGQF